MKDSGSGIIRYVLLGFAITALLVGAKEFVEHTSWGHRAEVFAFEFLEGQLSPFDVKEPLPVVVVDISGISESKNHEVVDLQKLKEVVGAIAEQNPGAIGIDAVLTPEPGDGGLAADQQTLDDNYFNFLDFCLAKIIGDKKIPVFVGVAERAAGTPEEWLGDEKYKGMAANVHIPREDTTRLPIWFKADAQGEKLYSMSAALVRSSQKMRLPSGWAWAVESVDGEFPGSELHLKEDIESAETLVNFSKLEAIEQTKLLTITEASIRESGEKFRNRIIILGNARNERANDQFIVIGRAEPVPGVYLHAAGVYTLAREPMYEFKYMVRLMLDLLLSAFIILFVAAARYRHIGERKHFNWHQLQNRLVLGSLIAVLVFAVLLVRYSGILWLDFLLVIFALWIHPKVETKFTRAK